MAEAKADLSFQDQSIAVDDTDDWDGGGRRAAIDELINVERDGKEKDQGDQGDKGNRGAETEFHRYSLAYWPEIQPVLSSGSWI